MTPLPPAEADPKCNSSYQSATVSSCTIFELYDVEEYRDVEIWFRVTQDH